MAVEIKICGLTRAADARAAEAAGATFGGVILAPESPRAIPPRQVESIFAGTALRRCGVFVNASLEDVARIVEAAALDVAQLHGDEPPEFARSVRQRAGVTVWKAIRPRSGEEFQAQASRYAGSVDALLVDGWSPVARGGTGTAFPWIEVARRRSHVDPSMRLVVAGGLDPRNVAEVIALLDPDIVDVSSGVETAPGIKDPESIRSFAAAVAGAAASRKESIDGRGSW